MKKIIFIILIALWSCASDGIKDQADNNNINGADYDFGKLTDYIPNEPGTILTYEITRYEQQAIFCQEIYWPEKNDAQVVVARGVFNGDTANKKKFILVLKVKGESPIQSSVGIPSGTELIILRDDLGIYEKAKQLFWALDNKKDNFIWDEIMTLNPNHVSLDPRINSRNSWANTKNLGYTQKIFCFEGMPQTALTVIERKIDILMFDGVFKVPGLNIEGLKFTRTIEPDPDLGKSINFMGGYQEESYFAKNLGLVYLKQTIAGKTSMVWRRINI